MCGHFKRKIANRLFIECWLTTTFLFPHFCQRLLDQMRLLPYTATSEHTYQNHLCKEIQPILSIYKVGILK